MHLVDKNRPSWGPLDMYVMMAYIVLTHTIFQLTISPALILIDPTSDIVVHPTRTAPRRLVGPKLPQIPRRIAIETISQTPTYVQYQATDTASQKFQATNSREELLRFFHTSPPGWRMGNHSILCLTYYPIQTIIQEWIVYALLMGRYVKYYEYSSQTAHSRLERFEKDDILDLHRWRRRSLQSLHKLDILKRFVDHWVLKEENLDQDLLQAANNTTTREGLVTWNLLKGDIKYLEEQIMQHARSLEALNPIITALVQLVDSKRAYSQAEDTRRLTYIAILFIPMSFITGIFSMSEPYGPGSDRFWIYWVVALPLTAFIIGSLVLDLRFGYLSLFWARMLKTVEKPLTP